MNQKFLSRVQKGIPFIAFTSDVHPRLSLSFNFFKISHQESYNNEKFLLERGCDQSMFEHYTSLNPDHNKEELDKILDLLKSHHPLYKSFPHEKRLLINTAFINNFDYFKEKNMSITFKVMYQIFSIRPNLVRRDWIIQNEEAIMEKLYNFIKDLFDDNQIIFSSRIVSTIWIFRDWDLINRVFTHLSDNFYNSEYPSARDLLNVIAFYIKYKCFSINHYLNNASCKFLWLLFTPLMINTPQMRSCDFLFPKRANLKPFGSDYTKEIEKAMEMVRRYSTAFTIKESATYLRFFAEYQNLDIPLIQRLLDHTYRSIMTKEAPAMRFHFIDIICNLPRLQKAGVRVPDYYYIFLYKAIIGSKYLIFLDMPKSCLEYLELADLPDNIKKIVLKVYFLNQRLQSTILTPFDNLSRIYSDDSIAVDYSPIEYPDPVEPNLMGVNDFNLFNPDLRSLAPNSEETFNHFKMMEGKSDEEVIEQISMTIDILSTKISIRSRLTCIGYLIYLARYNPSFVREYLESRNCNICPFNSMIYMRQIVQHFYMLYALTGDQVISIWIFFTKNSDKLFGLVDAIDFLLSLKIIKVTEHQGYSYLQEIFNSLNQDISRINQQIFETIYIFTCWTGFFESGVNQPEVSTFYNAYLEKMSMILATQAHYINYMRYILNWLNSRNELSPDNQRKFAELMILTDEEVEMSKGQNAAITRTFYRENVSLAMSLGKFFALNFMSVEGLNLSVDDLDESLKQRLRKNYKRLNLDSEEPE